MLRVRLRASTWPTPAGTSRTRTVMSSLRESEDHPAKLRKRRPPNRYIELTTHATGVSFSHHAERAATVSRTPAPASPASLMAGVHDSTARSSPRQPVEESRLAEIPDSGCSHRRDMGRARRTAIPDVRTLHWSCITPFFAIQLPRMHQAAAHKVAHFARGQRFACAPCETPGRPLRRRNRPQREFQTVIARRQPCAANSRD